MHILIAELENGLLSLFKNYVSPLGMNMETANTGQDALNYFFETQDKKKQYDIIVLDTHLLNPTALM